MSDAFADLRHGQMQRDYARVLKEKHGFPDPTPLTPAYRSRRLVQESWSELHDARGRGEVTTERFPRLEDVLERLSELGIWSAPSKYLWMLVGCDGLETGFFEGSLTPEALASWFSTGQDSALIRGITSPERYLIDKVSDDPMHGDFLELESWSHSEPTIASVR